MDTITLDTNAIIDLIEGRSDYEFMKIIIEKHIAKEINVVVTTRVTYELEKKESHKDILKKHNKLLEQYGIKVMAPEDYVRSKGW